MIWAAIVVGTATVSGVYNWHLVTDDWRARWPVVAWCSATGLFVATALLLCRNDPPSLVFPAVAVPWFALEIWLEWEMRERDKVAAKLRAVIDATYDMAERW